MNKPLNLVFPPKCNWNRFSIACPICPYAGLPVITIGSKVMADCCITHQISPRNFWWAYIHIIFLCTTKWDASIDWLVQIVGIIATNNWHTCKICTTSIVVTRCCCRGMHAALVECFIGQRWHRTNLQLFCCEGQTLYMFLECKLINFYIKIKTLINFVIVEM